MPERLGKTRTGQMWYIRDLGSPRLFDASAMPLRYSARYPELRADYAIYVQGRRGVAGFAAWAETGDFMVVTDFGAATASAARDLNAELRRMADRLRYRVMIFHDRLSDLPVVRFRAWSARAYITRPAYAEAERLLTEETRRSGRKLLPDKRFKAAYHRALHDAILTTPPPSPAGPPRNTSGRARNTSNGSDNEGDARAHGNRPRPTRRRVLQSLRL